MYKRAYADLSTIVYDASIAAEATVKLAPKASPITKEDALKTGAYFATLVREKIDPNALIFVFGSTVKGEANINSDIDIAVITEAFGNDVMSAYVALSMLANEASWDIEIHAVAPIDWQRGDPHVLEIKKWGIPA